MKKRIVTTLLAATFTTILHASSLVSSHENLTNRYETKSDSANFIGKWTATIEKDTVFFKISNGSGNVQSRYRFLLKEFSSHPGGSQTFKVMRDAGTMYFEGRFEGDTGAGIWLFTPDLAFNNFLKSRGFPTLEEPEYLVFYLTSMSKQKAQELHQLGYASTKAKLLALGALSIDSDYIQSWQKYGYNNLSYNEVIGLKAMGVTQNYANKLKALGYKEISTKYLIQLKALAVSADYIKRFNEIGFRAIPLNAITNAKAVGLSSKDVSLLRNKGHHYSSLSRYTHLKVSGKIPQ